MRSKSESLPDLSSLCAVAHLGHLVISPFTEAIYLSWFLAVNVYITVVNLTGAKGN